LTVVDTADNDRVLLYRRRADQAGAERFIAERVAVDAIPADRRPTSQEVAEVAVTFGIDSVPYRTILGCHFGSCFHYGAHRRSKVG
jgi:hypothetical protein